MSIKKNNYSIYNIYICPCWLKRYKSLLAPIALGDLLRSVEYTLTATV